jgi:hypothetical protein
MICSSPVTGIEPECSKVCKWLKHIRLAGKAREGFVRREKSSDCGHKNKISTKQIGAIL